LQAIKRLNHTITVQLLRDLLLH